jgi:hypothetical protein
MSALSSSSEITANGLIPSKDEGARMKDEPEVDPVKRPVIRRQPLWGCGQGRVSVLARPCAAG